MNPQNDPLKDVLGAIRNMASGIADLYTKPRELAAIWLETPVITGSGKTPRIAPGEMVRVNADGRIVDITPDQPATHKVIGCYGTLVSQFEFTLVSLADNQPLQLKLK